MFKIKLIIAQIKNILTEDKLLKFSFFILVGLLFLIVTRSALMSSHSSIALIQAIIRYAYIVLIPISFLMVAVRIILFLICLVRKSCRRLQHHGTHILFYSLFFALLSTLSFNTGSSWTLELKNPTNKDVVFNSDYCPERGTATALPVPKNSTRYFYCNNNSPHCSGSGKKICVDGIGCGRISHGSCSGFLGGEVRDVKMSTASLSKYSDPAWLSKLNKSTKKDLLNALSKNNDALRYASLEHRDDRQIILASVDKAGYSLQYASNRLQDDKEVVLMAVKQDGMAIKFASERLKGSKEIVYEAYKYWDSSSFEHANDILKSDREFVLKLLAYSASALEYASPELQNDRELVLAAVKKRGSALRHASDRLKNDQIIVTAASKQDGHALRFASDQLKKDKKFILELLNIGITHDIDADFYNDREVVLAAVKVDGLFLSRANKKFSKDKEIATAAVSQTVYAFKYVDDELKEDRDLILATVRTDGWNITQLDSDYLGDKEVVIAAVTSKGDVFKRVDNWLKKDRDVVLAAVKSSGYELKYAHKKFRKDKEVVIAAVKQYYKAYDFVDDALKQDKDVIQARNECARIFGKRALNTDKDN